MINKCEICKNKEICKYRKEYEARFKELAELDESKIRENPTFSIDLDCKYYEKEKQLSTQEMAQLLNRNYIECNKPASVLDNITLTNVVEDPCDHCVEAFRYGVPCPDYKTDGCAHRMRELNKMENK